MPVILLLFASAVQLQIIHIDGPPICGRAPCGISAIHVASLGSLDDPVSFSDASSVAMSSDGRFYVAPLASEGEIAAFSSRGRYERSIGRSGEGPEELQRISRIRMSHGDTLFVIQGARLSLINPASGKSIDSNILSIQPRDFTFLADGRPVAQYWPFGRLEEVPRFHVIDLLSGDVTHAFALGIPPSASSPYASIQQIAPGCGGNLWSAEVVAYHIDCWTIAGVVARSIRRDVEWFPSWKGEMGADQVRRSRVAAVFEDGAGRIWTAVSIWAGADIPRPNEHGEHIASDFLPWRVWDTVVEVLDPETATVLGSYRFDGAAVGFLGRNEPRIAILSETDVGLVTADVWLLRLN